MLVPRFLVRANICTNLYSVRVAWNHRMPSVVMRDHVGIAVPALQLAAMDPGVP